jgi:ATP-dependent DNA helicase RecG
MKTMMIDLAAAQAGLLLTRLLMSPESRTLDVKRVSGKMVQKALETICAFANTDGGMLALGIEDPAKAKGEQRLYGVQENPEAVDELQRKVRTQFNPPIEGIRFLRLPCALRDGTEGHVVLVQVSKSNKVHSIVNDGTWTRLDASNREMTAAEITDLAYQRGVKSAETLPIPVPLDLLDTAAWRSYCATRGLDTPDLPTRLPRLGLAQQTADGLQPLLAAVLLFADEPGALLAAQGMRADIRVFHYKGKTIERGAVPNLWLAPKTISGPLVQQIAQAHAYVLERLARGLIMAGSGFQTAYRFPQRVVKEAITNAVIHRDYRLNRDIHIRIFDDRIEVESPGLLPGTLTLATVGKAGSVPRNSLLARHLREFPNPPNVDAGEGVPMMFKQMQAANLYEPLYREQREMAQPTLLVTLLNEERPPLWVQVSDWVDRNGPIANGKLREISGLDTLAASRQLRNWVAQGVLVALPAASRQQARYTKPELLAGPGDSLSLGLDNETEKTKKLF